MTVCSALLVACFVTEDIAGGAALTTCCAQLLKRATPRLESMLSGDSAPDFLLLSTLLGSLNHAILFLYKSRNWMLPSDARHSARALEHQGLCPLFVVYIPCT